jgi:hypothetical protein
LVFRKPTQLLYKQYFLIEGKDTRWADKRKKLVNLRH